MTLSYLNAFYSVASNIFIKGNVYKKKKKLDGLYILVVLISVSGHSTVFSTLKWRLSLEDTRPYQLDITF